MAGEVSTFFLFSFFLIFPGDLTSETTLAHSKQVRSDTVGNSAREVGRVLRRLGVGNEPCTPPAEEHQQN